MPATDRERYLCAGSSLIRRDQLPVPGKRDGRAIRMSPPSGEREIARPGATMPAVAYLTDHRFLGDPQ